MRAPQDSSASTALLPMATEQHLGEIGVAEPTELDALWPIFTLDLIQAPFNDVDRRLATSGWLARLHDFECEVHIRTVFLGLLWDEWQRWLQQRRLTPL
jgi:hypothetical protein